MTMHEDSYRLLASVVANDNAIFTVLFLKITTRNAAGWAQDDKIPVCGAGVVAT